MSIWASAGLRTRTATSIRCSSCRRSRPQRRRLPLRPLHRRRHRPLPPSLRQHLRLPWRPRSPSHQPTQHLRARLLLPQRRRRSEPEASCLPRERGRGPAFGAAGWVRSNGPPCPRCRQHRRGARSRSVTLVSVRPRLGSGLQAPRRARTPGRKKAHEDSHLARARSSATVARANSDRPSATLDGGRRCSGWRSRRS
jgi:hypothetical protein